MTASTRTTYIDFFKPLIDRAVAVVCLVVFAPIFVIVALAVRCKLGSPVLFAQVRPGKLGHPFSCFKFRTMTEARDETGRVLPDSERMTPLGKWLRSTSLDELPELWNVLRGEMSIVGPRPLLMEYLKRYTPEQSQRHEVKPGITGWAQVHGRNGIPWEQRFELDLWYARHCSLLLDLQILVLTVFAVLSRRGISAEGHATMPRFDEVNAAETYDRAA